MPEFSNWSPWLNAAVFIATALAVWWAGSRLTRYADAISELTGMGEAMVGMLVLGGVTSLPEIAVSVTAGLDDNADLAVSNLLGGVALQVVIIAVGDALLRGRALTSQVPSPTVLLQGIFSCVLLIAVAMGVVAGDAALFGVGAWTTGMLVGGLGMFWLIARYKRRETWKAIPQPASRPAESQGKPDTLRRAVLLTAAMGGIILCGGWLLASTGDALATQTGLGESFVGMTLVGTATSLPEISTVVMAVRIRRYTMAFADIFSTNIIDLMLVFLIDAVAPGQPVLDTQGNFAAFGALLGVVVTLIYLAGLVERRDRTWLRLGPDSWLVLATYLGGVVVLYFLK